MTALRRHLLRHRWLAASLFAAALLMRLLVPVGYMASSSGGHITIELCSGVASVPMEMAPGAAMAGSMPMPGAHHSGAHDGKAEMPCAFSALAAPAVAATDPVLLALAIAFVFAAIFRPAAIIGSSSPAFLRPPARGPPATA